jgi:hypothetical protein
VSLCRPRAERSQIAHSTAQTLLLGASRDFALLQPFRGHMAGAFYFREGGTKRLYGLPIEGVESMEDVCA